MSSYESIVIGSDWISQHYLTSDAKGTFNSEVKKREKDWKEQEQEGRHSPKSKFTANRTDLLRALSRASESRASESGSATESDYREYLDQLLATLGFTNGRGVTLERQDSVLWVSRSGSEPSLAIIEMVPLETVEDVTSKDTDNLLAPTTLEEDDQAFTNGARLVSSTFLSDQKPPFVLMIAGRWVVLAEQDRWAEGRFLAINLQLVAERNDAKTAGEISTALTVLEIESLLPDFEGNAWWSRQLEESIKHTVGVSKDLREGVRKSIELIASDVVGRRKAQGLPPLPQSEAQVLARQSLRFLYRILFLLYAEASPELEVLPVGTSEYDQGYSLDRLRELVQVPLTDPEDQAGTHLYQSLGTLFRLVDTGFRGPSDQGIQFNALRADLFSENATEHIDRVGLGNQTLQKVLSRLFLSKEQRGKDRGFISYAELGINQLGAVYEGLMSYTGFFAEDYLYEVAPSGVTTKGSWVVSKDRIEGINSRDFVKKEDPVTGELKPVIYEPGSFVFRLAGRERQQSASYYTPEVLTRFTVDQGLQELITPEGKPELTAEQILSLKVCEPALGSGAFAIEATKQLAEKYLKKRQEELGETIDPLDYPLELQKTKAYIALHNVYGVDLNDTAVELAEISLWLDTMVAGLDAPWFGLHLRAGNSLIGARHSAYQPHDLQKRSWLKTPPTSIPLTELSSDLEGGRIATAFQSGAIHHFLLPADGWGSAAIAKVAKELEPERTKELSAWAKAIKTQPTKAQVQRLQGLSLRVERLWQFALQRLRIAEEQSARFIDVWGKETETKNASVQREQIEEALGDPNGSYQRLRTVMNAWSALWFWPVTEQSLKVETEDGTLTAKPPTLERWIATLEALLGKPGKKADWYDETLVSQADWNSLTEAEQLDLGFSGALDATKVRTEQPWLQVADRVAKNHRFFHWELDFATVFAEGGFDLQVGNPPWVRPTFSENDILAEGDPWWQLTSGASNQTLKDRREQTLALPGIRDLVTSEAESINGQAAFMGSPAEYPLLKGLQPDTYRCFMEQTWRNASPDGIISLIHPESHFTDTKAGVLRNATYPRLRRHWQFINEKQLFEEVAHIFFYGVHTYGPLRAQPDFIQASSLYTPETVYGSLRHDGSGEEPGIKDREGNWDTSNHVDRIMHVDRSVLELWNSVIGDDDSTPLSTPMLYTVNTSIQEVLQKTASAHKIKTLDPKFSGGWHETGARSEGKFDHGWGAPDSWEEVILKGPNIHVGNPSYKYPRETMKSKGDWHPVDLESLAPDAIPVTPYKRTASKELYDAAYTNWGKNGESDPARDHYRLTFRAMAANTGERTLIGAIIPPGAAHIHRLLSVGLKDPQELLTIAGFSESLILDLVVRSSPKSDVLPSVVERLPLVADHPLLPALRLRVLRLNCLTRAYTDLWNETWDPSFESDQWAGGRPRANRLPLVPQTSAHPECWSPDSPLRIAEDRRQALVEIDALVAVMLGISADQLASVYRTAFPVLYGYDTGRDYYDQNGRLVPDEIVKAWKAAGGEDMADRSVAPSSEVSTRGAPTSDTSNLIAHASPAAASGSAQAYAATPSSSEMSTPAEPGSGCPDFAAPSVVLTPEERTATNESRSTYTYEPLFVLLDREADLKQAHAHFTKLVQHESARHGE